MSNKLLIIIPIRTLTSVNLSLLINIFTRFPAITLTATSHSLLYTTYYTKTSTKMRFTSMFLALPLVASVFAAPLAPEVPSLPAAVETLPIQDLDIVSIVTELQASIVSTMI